MTLTLPFSSINNYMAMAVTDSTKADKKVYDYGEIKLSMENCIFPCEMLDETPSMKDGLDRDTENDLRRFGCELIQISGLLLKLPQVAMATGQVILQRFYYIKSMIKHDMETTAMAAIFLAAKIEESPRRVRDVINVCEHIKQKKLRRPETPMEYNSNHYFSMKNNVIKAERRILKELGFCVHVKHPHKIIITYLQILEHEKNVALARAAWNYMNDSLRTDVFVRFSPDMIACACIFLAARTVKVNLPMKPPWWQLFDASYEDVEDISLCILRLYSHRPTKITHLELIVKKLKKEKKIPTKTTPDVGSFTPNSSIKPASNNNSEHNSKPTSKNPSPAEKTLSSVINYKKVDNENSYDKRKPPKGDNNDREKYDYSSDESSDSETELPSKKYEKQREQYETNKKRRQHSSDSETDIAKAPRKINQNEDIRKIKNRDIKDKTKSFRPEIKESNGKYNSEKNRDYNKHNRDRSRSPKGGRAISPYRKSKYGNSEKNVIKEKNQSKSRYTDKYSSWR